MGARTVQTAYHHAVRAEQTFLGSDTAGIVQGMAIPYFGDIVASRGDLARNLDETKPLPSHRLAMSAFSTFSNPPGTMSPNTRDAVANFHNRVVLPLAGIEPPGEPTARLRASSTGGSTCPRTEPTFVDAARQVATVHAKDKLSRRYVNQHTGHSRISVYADEAGTPLILRKQRDISLGLTLAHIMLDDALIVPAGSFVGIGHTDDGIQQEARHTYQAGSRREPIDYRFSTFTVSDEFAMRPLRIGPWAYDDPVQRAFFGMTQGMAGRQRYDRSRGAEVTAHTLGDFQQAAHRIMELCT